MFQSLMRRQIVRREGYRPSLEILEGRLLLTTFVVTIPMTPAPDRCDKLFSMQVRAMITTQSHLT
jgi:hypothetical protein